MQENKVTKTPKQPVKPKIMMKVLVLIIVILAYLAGFYHSALQVEKQKYQFLKLQCDPTSNVGAESIKLETL